MNVLNQEGSKDQAFFNRKIMWNIDNYNCWGCSMMIYLAKRDMCSMICVTCKFMQLERKTLVYLSQTGHIFQPRAKKELVGR